MQEDEVEEESEESEEEDEYVMKERTYQVKSVPDEYSFRNFKKKVSLPDYLTNSKVLVANFVAEDCNYILKKLISIVDLLSETLTILVLPLPKGATNLDTYYARTLCKLFHHRGRELNIFFIKQESKEDLITKVFKREKKSLR